MSSKIVLLHEKMLQEQNFFEDWLKNQPAEEILKHSYEYTVRNDIVMAIENLRLTDAQAQALLDSPSPLDDVYRYFEKLETGYMDTLRESIENRADDVCRAMKSEQSTPLPHKASIQSKLQQIKESLPDKSVTPPNSIYKS